MLQSGGCVYARCSLAVLAVQLFIQTHVLGCLPASSVGRDWRKLLTDEGRFAVTEPLGLGAIEPVSVQCQRCQPWPAQVEV